jgi:ribokinase
MSPHHVLVVGSANVDLVVRLDAPPGAGQTVLAQRLERHPGGKGANQAVAAARMGATVQLVGCVGDDADGERLVHDLGEEGIDTSTVAVAHDVPTGLAFVSVFPDGENSIVVVPGANFAVQPEQVRRAVDARSAEHTVLVLQGEVTTAVIEAAVASAAPAGSAWC